MNTSASQSRYAYLEQEYITIEAGDDNFTTYLRFDGEDSAFSTNDSIYTIGLKSCIYCELGVPTATVLTVQSSKTGKLTLSDAVYDLNDDQYCRTDSIYYIVAKVDIFCFISLSFFLLTHLDILFTYIEGCYFKK